MVPKKAQSKRVNSAQRAKVSRKIREHNRNQRKADGSLSKKSKKDPGIPNLFPLKDKILAEIAISKQKLPIKTSVAQLATDAANRSAAFNRNVMPTATAYTVWDSKATSEAAVTGKKDNSRKAYYKEFKKVVDQADVILEVLDARDPLGCRTKQVEEMIQAAGGNKRIILILNKIDLVPRENVQAWLKHLRMELPTIAFKASTQMQRSNLSQSTVSSDKASESLLTSSECLGADNLMKILKNYCRNANIKTSISVGVIGFPNVGKSSVINSLKRSRVCGVGATPGLTKSTQEVTLDKNIKLIDCPGIVFSKSMDEKEAAQVMLRNCVKVELLEDPIPPVELIVSRCTTEQLCQMYKIPPFTTTTQFLIEIARLRGRIRKHGIPDLENAARSILQDWNAGRIPYYTQPPKSKNTNIGENVVLGGLGDEFQIGDVVEVEGRLLDEERPEHTKMMEFMCGDEMECEMDGDMPREYQRFEQMMDESDSDAEMQSDEELVPMDVEMSDEEEDVDPLANIVINPKSRKLQKKEVEEPVMDDTLRALNPQHGATMKKNRKAAKKQIKKAGKASDDVYDFGEYFGGDDDMMED